MRISSMLQSATILGLAVVAGLMGVSGTWALWNATAPADAGSVQSANFVVTVNGADMILNDTVTTVALENPSAALTPDTPVYASLKLTNSTDASSEFTIRSTVGTPQIASKNAELSSSLVVRSAVMPAAGDCSSAVYPTGASPGTTSAEVAKGESQRFCLRMSLPAKAPESLIKSAATVTVPVHVEQIK